jgi:hypothetical protein
MQASAHRLHDQLFGYWDHDWDCLAALCKRVSLGDLDPSVVLLILGFSRLNLELLKLRVVQGVEWVQTVIIQ